MTQHSLLSFARFLRDRHADILADWRTAAGPEGVSSNGAGRMDVLGRWLEHLTARAEGRPASMAGALTTTNPNGTLSDLSLLHRLIARRAHVEHADWGLHESELLWGAFGDALADLISRDNATGPEAGRVRGNGGHRAAVARERLFREASRILAESLDYEGTLRSVARLAVPEIADWCIIDLIGEAGTLVRVATEHRDPDIEPLRTALHHNPPAHDAVSGAPHVVRTGVTEYVPLMSQSLLRQREQDERRRSILTSLGLHSTICAPLVARDRILGALTLSTAAGRDLTPDDVRMAEDLARRAAFAIENARVYDEAQRAIRAREEILAIVTHDLRTPLSAVTAGASLLISMDSVDPDGSRIRQRGETIQRAALHMARLIKDLTDLAQIDAGRLAIDKTMEDPAEVVNEVVEALEPLLTRRGGTLHARVNADVPRSPLDRDRLRQVLANLVGNASKVGSSEISIGAEVRGADLVFWVADNGPGIPPQDLSRMFNRYFRRSGTRYEGSGLGLPISNGIVTAHGGRMWIESTPGLGSTFYFSIPR